jgi:hypothetical protein
MAQKKSNLPIGYTPPKRGERIKASDIQGIAKAVKRLTRQGGEGYQTAFPSATFLPFQIYTGLEIPEGETESQIFIGAYPGTLEVEVFDDVKEYSPTTGTWYLQARIEIDPDTGETIDKAVEFVTTMGTNTGVLFHLQIGSIQVDVSGTPQNNTISQTNYGPIQVVKYGGIVQKWNVVLY